MKPGETRNEEGEMAGYMTLVLGMILLPCLYGGSMVLYRDSFQEERNRSRIPLRTGRELAVMLLGELALVRVWWT